ncbi:MAG: hypothetical protein Q9M37_07160, partial [Desulfonauticus sp.]|nr:hypothetical protein [Desulfonauticus sp.]
EGAAEMVLEVLEEKFGLLPPSVVRKIKNIEQKEILKGLLRSAIKVNSLEEFKNLLKQLEADSFQ